MSDWWNRVKKRATLIGTVPHRVRPYLARAVLCLIAAKIALKLIPMRHLAVHFSRQPRRPGPTDSERETLRQQVQWLIDRATQFVPWEATCFHRAVAAQFLFRIAGVPTTLHYGARSLPGEGLTGHTWLMDGEEVVMGWEEASSFPSLVHFPDVVE